MKGGPTEEYRKKGEVNANEKWERDFWTDQWGIRDAELSEAIEKTGSNKVEKLEKYLISKRISE